MKSDQQLRIREISVADRVQLPDLLAPFLSKAPLGPVHLVEKLLKGIKRHESVEKVKQGGLKRPIPYPLPSIRFNGLEAY